MRAIVLEKFGDLDSVVYKDIPEPEPKAGHVVIQAYLGRLLQEKRT
jgi:NADPH:quinone reductase